MEVITNYVRLDTSNQLLMMYREIASNLAQSVTVDNPSQSRYTAFELPIVELVRDDKYISKNLVLINLNASILEGYLRAVISDIVHYDRNALGQHWTQNAASPVGHSLEKAYRNMRTFIDEIENKGGYTNLKSQYKSYLEIDLNTVSTSQTKHDIDALFLLRNIAAHGTALVAPTQAMPDNQKEYYPYKWQSQLKALSVLTNREFGCSVHEALRHPVFASYFMSKTQELVRALNTDNRISGVQEELFNNLNTYNFGFVA
ncbi:hypothetical protein ABMX92_21490 [Vibrio vulnificus]|uniref:hypothetical protein n=1 Tax=Vibrio vulnificus TaxID=672 RepID=UPI001A1A6D25|nr:hypothetical protein [Vibrio vulnificus]EIU7554457.1 hypothetical protein [Vibrio vulnificus]ELH3492685.1 hypothetical protein [Vibrio vulnificus]HAS8201395.1 hypothetical protein [Vibrio vulnificus]